MDIVLISAILGIVFTIAIVLWCFLGDNKIKNVDRNLIQKNSNYYLGFIPKNKLSFSFFVFGTISIASVLFSYIWLVNTYYRPRYNTGFDGLSLVFPECLFYFFSFLSVCFLFLSFILRNTRFNSFSKKESNFDKIISNIIIFIIICCLFGFLVWFSFDQISTSYFYHKEFPFLDIRRLF
jgi:hypothetical protein